jgi:tRNA G18 (ribose-2'-O)-methylase SpoU
VLFPLDDPSDPRLDDYRNVPDADLLEQRGIFVAEGRLVVRRLLTSSRFAARSVLVTPPAYDALKDLLDERDLPVFVVPQALLNGITGFNIHRGCLAIGIRDTEPDWRRLSKHSPLVVVERVGNADNIGAIFRNAAAFGAAGVLLERSCTDPLYRKAIRTSMGAALSVPFARLEPWPDVLGAMRRAGIALVGLKTGAVEPIDAVARALRGQMVALLVGHEGDGLSEAAIAACDHLACIPMAAGVDSLNVATAAGIGLYEFRKGSPDP